MKRSSILLGAFVLFGCFALGTAEAGNHEGRSLDRALQCTRCATTPCCCPDDYCRKPMPCVPCLPKSYCPPDYCPKPMPCVPCLPKSCCPPDYCRKPLPNFCNWIVHREYYRCGPSCGRSSATVPAAAAPASPTPAPTPVAPMPPAASKATGTPGAAPRPAASPAGTK